MTRNAALGNTLQVAGRWMPEAHWYVQQRIVRRVR